MNTAPKTKRENVFNATENLSMIWQVRLYMYIVRCTSMIDCYVMDYDRPFKMQCYRY